MMKKPKLMHAADCDCEMCHGGKMAKGGPVEIEVKEEHHIPAESASEDHELHDIVGNEMMDAVHSKDHKKFMGGLEAMVLRCLNKKD